ncbi:unnamed protein product, partial [Meganyctiphanes norvegica]
MAECFQGTTPLVYHTPCPLPPHYNPASRPTTTSGGACLRWLVIATVLGLAAFASQGECSSVHNGNGKIPSKITTGFWRSAQWCSDAAGRKGGGRGGGPPTMGLCLATWTMYTWNNASGATRLPALSDGPDEENVTHTDLRKQEN